MPTEPIFDGLIRVNLTMEKALHKVGIERAQELGLTDGFSGLVSRLLIKDQAKKSPDVARISRRFTPTRVK